MQTEIPGLGQTVVADVKYIYAWVKQNNLRESITNRVAPVHQPSGDWDCRLGVKRSHDQDQADGSTEVKKEYLWGYGSGIMAVTNPEYGDVVLAEYSQSFNETDLTYFESLYEQVVEHLGFRPCYFAADAAFVAWHIYHPFAEMGSWVPITLNLRGHPKPQACSSLALSDLIYPPSSGITLRPRIGCQGDWLCQTYQHQNWWLDVGSP